MITTKILNQAVGVQRDRAKDKTETATLPSANNGIIVGAFKRGRADKPFKVTRDNYKAILGRDIGNPSYMAVEDAFMRGIKELWVCRLAPGRPPAQGLAKDYSGSGWYKATDTGIVYNKGVPEGETHSFKGDPKEYISVYTKEDARLYAERAATSNLTDMSMLFRGESSFNGDISHWDTSNVTNMSYMFAGATAFNQPLSFDTSKVTNINSMFYGATSFNQPLSFDTSKVTNTSYMFSGATAYNQPIKLDTSNVTDMNNMFARAASFNKPLSLDTSQVTNMSGMFQEATSFNQPLDFDTSSVVDMRYMLSGATAFNQPLSFDTSSATLMNAMLSRAASFNQDLSQWCVAKIPSTPPGFDEDASAWTKPRPVWGTCPRGEDQA